MYSTEQPWIDSTVYCMGHHSYFIIINLFLPTFHSPIQYNRIFEMSIADVYSIYTVCTTSTHPEDGHLVSIKILKDEPGNDAGYN